MSVQQFRTFESLCFTNKVQNFVIIVAFAYITSIARIPFVVCLPFSSWQFQMGQNCCGFSGSVSDDAENKGYLSQKNTISMKTSRRKRLPTLASAQRPSLKVAKKAPSGKNEKKKVKSKQVQIPVSAAKKKPSLLSKANSAIPNQKKSKAVVPSKIQKASTSEAIRQKSSKCKKVKSTNKSKLLSMSKVQNTKTIGQLEDVNSKVSCVISDDVDLKNFNFSLAYQ